LDLENLNKALLGEMEVEIREGEARVVEGFFRI